MTPSTHLFELIKSLTKQEKIFFKRNCYPKKKGEKVYMAMYDAMYKQREYDEKKLKKKFQTKLAPGSFQVIKNYLSHVILDRLCSYYSDDLPGFTVRQMIEKATVLDMKQFKNEAWKLIRKAKQSAFKNELFPEAIKALEIERIIIEYQDTKVYKESIADNLAEEKIIIEKHNNLTKYVHLHSEMSIMYRSNIIARNKQVIVFFNKMLKHPLLQDKSSALSYRASFLFFIIKSICYNYLGNTKNSFKYIQKLVNMLESTPMVSGSMKMYIRSLYLMAGLQSNLGKFTDSMQSVRKIKNIGNAYPQFAKSIPPQLSFTESVIIETDLYLRIPDYEVGVAQVPRIEAELKKFKYAIPKDTLLVLYYNLNLLYFGTGNYHKALYWLNKY